MEGPVKKRKHTFVSQNKILFDRVFPWLFYGHYTDRLLAFRTLLALTGTCRQLRYFQLLRRYVAFLTPSILRERLRDHGFPVAAPTTKWIKMLSDRVFGIGNVLYLLEESPSAIAPFEKTFRDVSFFNLAKRVGPDQTSSLIHMPSTFAELALFCYCVVEATDEEVAYDTIDIVPQWKIKSEDTMKIPVKLRQNFASRFLLSKLSRIGTTAPLDPEFVNGSLGETAFSLFSKMCNTNGRKDKQKPIQRLKSFVQAWFPMTRVSTGPADKKRRAYEFEMEFEN